MTVALPSDPAVFTDWTWSEIEPLYKELESRSLDGSSLSGFLRDWSALRARLDESHSRLYLATALDTEDGEAQRRYHNFLADIFPNLEAAEQRLKQKLLESRLEPGGFEVPLRNMRAEVELFRAENIPLLAKEKELEERYNKIIGAETVEWEGRETPIPQLLPVYQNPDRAVRERAWRLAADRQLKDRGAINDLWREFLQLRLQLSANAGMADYRAYKWKQLQRFDYSPRDASVFHKAVEDVAVPAATRVHNRRRERLGLESLRPWDLVVDVAGRPPLRPFADAAELEAKTSSMFHRVDPLVGRHFDTMAGERLLDLENRKGKGPGGFCISFNASKRPFIFMNAVGIHFDVLTLLHEGGHAIHLFEAAHLPYVQQWQPGMEFLEVGSMAMELLASPYLDKGQGGFYNAGDAARARVDHLERMLLLWPRLTAIDVFQHWVYENPDDGAVPSKCESKWIELWSRFVPGVDWSELNEELAIQWQQVLHIHVVPFYIIEYGLGQLGAVQIWANALENQQEAVTKYLHALSLGNTRSVTELYEAAGAKFAFDAETLRGAVALLEQTIEALERETG